MTVRRTNGAFDGVPGINLTFNVPSNYITNLLDTGQGVISAPAGWTGGANVINAVNLLGPLPDAANIISYSVSAALALHTPVATTGGPKPGYGKFGKMLTALQFGDNASNVNSGLGVLPGPNYQFGQSNLLLPQDSTLTTTVWDPANDPLPPDDSGNPLILLPVSASLDLPVPIPIIEQQLTIGLWLLPSLLSSVTALWHGVNIPQASRQLAVFQGEYTVVYDDGR